ncbi:MAG: hypothetical protein QOG62_2084 [Thermoleophilaceae bacterium]|jgi:hypothetical protein|nr:hypothetical protein [Thermoleophilaceae bacterium]
MKSLWRAAAVSLLLALVPGTAQAATTVGQTGVAGGSCGNNAAFLQVATTPGPSYDIPAGGGVITRWRTASEGSAGGQLALRTYHGSSSGTAFTATAQGAFEMIPAAAGIKQFSTRLAVAAGDHLGFITGPAGAVACFDNTPFPGGKYALLVTSPLGVGEPQTYIVTTGFRWSVEADVEPDADNDHFGDETQDACPSQATTQAGCAAHIDSGPKAKSKSSKASFAFTAPGGGAGVTGFECQIDKKAFAACSSPAKFKKLDPGKHTFRVHVVGPGGVLGPDATFSWRIKKK